MGGAEMKPVVKIRDGGNVLRSLSPWSQQEQVTNFYHISPECFQRLWARRLVRPIAGQPNDFSSKTCEGATSMAPGLSGCGHRWFLSKWCSAKTVANCKQSC